MKNTIKIILSIGLVLITFLACTKDTDVLFSFDFELKEVHNEIATINYKEPTFITIDPERVVTTNVYSFSYNVSEGDAYLRYIGGEPLEQNIEINCENLDLDFEFIGTQLGLAVIDFKVQDQDGLEKVITIQYEVINNDFVWDANSTTTSVTTGQETPLTIILDNTGKDDSVTYKSKVYFTQGEGSVFEVDNSGSSTSEIELNEFSEILEDIHTYNIKLNETGVNKVIFEAIDSNGQIKKDSLIYNVDVNDFSYLGTPQVNEIFTGSTTDINFQITELVGTGDAYQSRFEFVRGNAIIKSNNGNNDEVITPGVSYDISAGQYSWLFEATESGVIDMIFYAKSSSEIEHQVPISINVNNGSFEINTIPSQTIATVNDFVSININIVENGPTAVPYNLQFNSNSNGTFTYDNTEYLPGQNITINDFST